MNLFKYITFVFLIPVLIGCNKDEDEVTKVAKVNYFTFQGEEYPIKQASLDFLYEMNGVYCYHLYFYTYNSSDISINGKKIYFRVFSKSDKGLPSARYTFIPFVREPMYAFNWGIVYNMKYKMEWGEFYTVDGGTLSILKTGNEYTIYMNCIFSANVLSGVYKGFLIFTDLSDKKSGSN